MGGRIPPCLNTSDLIVKEQEDYPEGSMAGCPPRHIAYPIHTTLHAECNTLNQNKPPLA